MQVLFEEIAPLLRKLTGSALVSFALYDAAQNRIVSRFLGESTGSELWSTLAVDESPDGWTWKNQQSLTIPDLEQETRFAETVRDLLPVGVRYSRFCP